MAAALLYAAVAAASLAAAHRWLRPLSRAAALVLALLPLCFTGRALLTGRVYGPVDLAYSAPPLWDYHSDYGVPAPGHNGALSDVYCQMIPWQQAVRSAWRHGEWPLWNPAILGGDVLAAAAVPAPYHPVHLAGLAVPLSANLGFVASAVLLLAGLGMFLFARDLRCGEAAALVGAAGWMFSDFSAFWLLWPQTLSVAVLPLVLLGVRQVVARPGARAIVILATGLTLSLLAGHPESTAHVVLIGVVWGAVELALRRPIQPLRAAGAAAAAGVATLLVCALYVLPILDALEQSAEHLWRSVDYAGTDRSVPLREVGPRLLDTLMPFALGRPGWGSEMRDRLGVEFVGGYAGSLLLPLGALGIVASRWRGRWLLVVLGVVGIWVGTAAPGLSDLVALVPPYHIAINERLVFIGAFALAALAALGAEALAAGPPMARARRCFVYAVLALALAVALLLPRIGEALEPELLRRHLALYLLPPAAGALLLWTRVRRWLVPVLLALLVAQRVGEAGAIYPVSSEAAFYPKVAPLTALPEAAEPYRAVGLGFTLIPNLSAMWEIEDPRGYQAITLARLNATYPLWSTRLPVWFNLVSTLDRPFLSFLNVRYALAHKSHRTPPDWRVVARARSMQLLENPRALPRAFVPPRVRRGGTARRVLREMREETDFGQRAWIEIPGEKPAPVRGQANGPGRVRTERAGTGYRLQVEMERRGWVVTSIAAWRGWRASAAGGPLPLAFANHAFVAFELPAGRHDVRLTYLPASFLWGRAITFSTLATLTAAGLVAGARRRRRLPAAEG